MSKYPRKTVKDLEFTPMIPGKGPGKMIQLPCFITSPISDTSSPAWSEHLDMGRPDPKVMYTGHNRTVGFSFMTVATTKDEHDENYKKLRQLALLTYPIRRSGQGYNAPFIMYNIAELINGIGYITSFDCAWELEYPWDDEFKRPLYTQVAISIRNLTDGYGNRPNYNAGNYKYFHTNLSN